MNKKLLEQIIEFSGKPALFAKGTGNIWTEPHLADQMLSCHVDLTNDLASRREETIERTVAFLNKRIKKGSSILDLGCGPGLYAERLFKSGHRVTGVDFSENSIEYARDSAKSKGIEIDYEDNIWAEQYIVIDEQDVKVYRNWFHDYTKESIVKVVQAAGFSEVQVLGGLYTEEEENEADWLTVIARA